jgi:hypothetical protein
MKKALLAAGSAAALIYGTVAFAQSSTVGPAPGVPAPEAQPGGQQQGGNKSERETRDELGAQRATGDQLGPPSGVTPSEDQVRRMLEKQGYSDIRGLQQTGDSFTGQAMKDGRSVQFRIDPHEGKVEEIGG